MSETIIFRGAFIRYLDVRQNKEGAQVFTRMHISADFSDTVREKMDWADGPGDYVKSAKLNGELLAENFILTPGDKNLKQHELQIAISDAGDFQVVTLKDGDGEPCGRELRFVVRSPGDGVEAQIGQYMRRVGRHQGELRISYLPQAQQEALPLAPGVSAEDKQVAIDVRVADESEGDQEHVSEFLQGEALERHNALSGEATKEAPLASAMTMGVGTHQKGSRRDRKPRNVDPEVTGDPIPSEQVN